MRLERLGTQRSAFFALIATDVSVLGAQHGWKAQ